MNTTDKIFSALSGLKDCIWLMEGKEEYRVAALAILERLNGYVEVLDRPPVDNSLDGKRAE